ncbi:uncharacterized protein GIQ15_02429 [Arthroderma uncinatum]|uniref:uncharacterized protein n=1 Tax=Arthroderma uncinatum TaxID=74035 RepID=UPI00144A576D|nr:uncharacterized protein GIQ15_02429 [Arthroderma uncinatum]KAF3483105.1 hypothetical protein GIQ15_02429 [Arthroderma uncinatum]
MSDSRDPGKPGGDKDKEDTFSKYIQRMKTVLKGPRSNRASISSMADAAPGEPRRPSAQLSARPRAAPAAPASPPADAGSPAPVAHQWTSMQEERARALFAKYGLTLEPGEWITGPATGMTSTPAGITSAQPPREVERVEKPIRMRVRRNCHRCLATFGADKGKERSQKKIVSVAGGAGGTRDRDRDRERERERERDEGRKTTCPEKIMLTIPSRTGGQDLVHKPVRQRVRRTCHICNTLFEGNATECLNCNHIRCKKCPRDPAKLNKYPDGYPGDAEPPFEPQERVWRRPRRRVRWTCHECSSMFTGGEKICLKCQHERCNDCIRDPPKKIKPEPDPEILRRVEEKLALIDVSS